MNDLPGIRSDIPQNSEALSQGLPQTRLLIAGRWVDGQTRMPVLDKYHGRPCATLHLPSHAQVAKAVSAAAKAFESSEQSGYERGVVLDNVAGLLSQRSEEIRLLLQTEGGFSTVDAMGEIARSVETFRLSAEEARRLAGEVVPLQGAPNQTGRLGFTMRVPLGVVCAITPFNAPLNTVAHKVAPALAAGNSVVLKPSTHTPTVANLLAEVLLEAGLEPSLISVLHGGADVASALLDEQAIAFFAFTGSTEVGRSIAKRAGLRRTQMELGSISFTILAADANLDLALPKVVNAGYRKAGQVCTSIQLLLVHRSLLQEVEGRLQALVQSLAFGDPSDPRTVVGPVISEASAKRIEAWIAQALEQGARCLAGGPRQGALVPPTLLADVDESMTVACQEVFGPVISIVVFDTLDEAIARINATPFGLASGLFTDSISDAFNAARRLQVGSVHINETSSSRADLMPYGGSKQSGFGREGPHYAVREMSEERLVTWIP